MSDDLPEVDVTPQDAIQVAQRALAKVGDVEDDLEDLRAENDDLRDRVVGLELRLSELDDETDYRDLSMDAKIGMVREHAFKKATNGHGLASLTYDDVMWEVFDGDPGNNHCYRLLRKAAGYNNDGEQVEDVPGFDLDQTSRPMKLTVDAAEAKKSAAFSRRNNPAQEGVGSQ